MANFFWFWILFFPQSWKQKTTIQGPNVFTSMIIGERTFHAPFRLLESFQLKKKSLLQIFRLPGCLIWQHFDIRSSSGTSEELQRRQEKKLQRTGDILRQFLEKKDLKKNHWNLWISQSHGYVDRLFFSFLVASPKKEYTVCRKYVDIFVFFSRMRVLAVYVASLWWRKLGSSSTSVNSHPLTNHLNFSHVRWCPKFVPKDVF